MNRTHPSLKTTRQPQSCCGCTAEFVSRAIRAYYKK